jgi:hypothetical protein
MQDRCAITSNDAPGETPFFEREAKRAPDQPGSDDRNLPEGHERFAG